MRTSSKISLLTSLFTLFLLGGPTFGQSIEQVFETMGGAGFETLSIEPFDDMNGARALAGIEVEYNAFIDMDILIENMTTLELESGDWFYDAGANIILAFDSKPGFEDGGPFYGLGGVFETGITGKLSAGSGGSPFDNPTPGDVKVAASLSNDFFGFVESTEMLSYFESESSLSAKLAPFQDFVLTPPEGDPFGLINATATSIEFGGTLTVRYNWVPGLGRPEDCNADGTVDALDLSCSCDAGILDDILNILNLNRGDLDGSGEVDFADFLALSGNFGESGDYSEGDLDCDGMVSFADFLILSGNFGQTSVPPAVATQSVPETLPSPWLFMIGLAFVFRRQRHLL